MSIVRVGLGESRQYAEGWQAVFGKKSSNRSASRGDSRAAKKSPRRKKSKKK
ncbi:MAG TPA: hypothetical protein PKD86_13100 [Gemmatales bacterium]|nr:hypothetical protein [Gemmatales bacterium]HMP60279.1 hypothetical protein [Gemmatales bacterium]